jgi:hypothetical protein
MEEKVQNALNHQDIVYIKQMLIDIKVEVKKTNGRVTTLELWKAKSLGIIVGVTTICSGVFAVFLSTFKNLFGE